MSKYLVILLILLISSYIIIWIFQFARLSTTIQFKDRELSIQYIRNYFNGGKHSQSRFYQVYLGYEYPYGVHHTYFEFYDTKKEADERVINIYSKIEIYRATKKVFDFLTIQNITIYQKIEMICHYILYINKLLFYIL